MVQVIDMAIGYLEHHMIRDCNARRAALQSNRTNKQRVGARLSVWFDVPGPGVAPPVPRILVDCPAAINALGVVAVAFTDR